MLCFTETFPEITGVKNKTRLNYVQRSCCREARLLPKRRLVLGI